MSTAEDGPDMVASASRSTTTPGTATAAGTASQPVTRPPSPDPSKKTQSLTIVIKLGA